MLFTNTQEFDKLKKLSQAEQGQLYIQQWKDFVAFVQKQYPNEAPLIARVTDASSWHQFIDNIEGLHPESDIDPAVFTGYMIADAASYETAPEGTPVAEATNGDDDERDIGFDEWMKASESVLRGGPQTIQEEWWSMRKKNDLIKQREKEKGTNYFSTAEGIRERYGRNNGKSNIDQQVEEAFRERFKGKKKLIWHAKKFAKNHKRFSYDPLYEELQHTIASHTQALVNMRLSDPKNKTITKEKKKALEQKIQKDVTSFHYRQFITKYNEKATHYAQTDETLKKELAFMQQREQKRTAAKTSQPHTQPVSPAKSVPKTPQTPQPSTPIPSGVLKELNQIEKAIQEEQSVIVASPQPVPQQERQNNSMDHPSPKNLSSPAKTGTKSAASGAGKQMAKQGLKQIASKGLLAVAAPEAGAGILIGVLVAAAIVLILIIVVAIYMVVTGNNDDGGCGSGAGTGEFCQIGGKIPGLTLEKTGPEESKNNEPIPYTITATYGGSNSITITDVVPDNASYVEGSATCNPTINDIHTEIGWHLTDITDPSCVEERDDKKIYTFHVSLFPKEENTVVINTVSASSEIIGADSFRAFLPDNLPGQFNPEKENKALERIQADVSFLTDVYKQASVQTHIPWEIFAGLHYREGDANRDLSLISGRPIGYAEPDRWKPSQGPREDFCPESNLGVPGALIPVDKVRDSDRRFIPRGGGCGFATLLDSAIYAGNVLIEKNQKKVPATFQEFVSAVSRYNGGGNRNNPKGEAYFGESDPYAMNFFSQQLYILYHCDGGCVYPEADPRPGVITVAKDVTLYLKP